MLVYESFFGLKERPFDLTPNPKYLFLTPSHREALSNLEYGLAARAGVTVLIGEAGTGKTTLIRATLESPDARRTFAVYLNNPTLTRDEFVEFLARKFQLAATSKTALLFDLEARLLRFRDAGTTVALIIDEAQSLPHELLEEIRLLANIETATEKLLSIVLAGQPELTTRLNQVELRQLKQRIGLRCQLRPLTLQETAQYVAARVRVAGGHPEQLFTREAIGLIHERSGGIPRTISVICHNALINAFALGRRFVDAEIVFEVCRDFDIDTPPVLAAESSAPRQDVPPAFRQKEVAAPPAASAADRSHQPVKAEASQAPGKPGVGVRGLFAHFAAPRRFSLFKG
jgi:general secretion pathway protein A